jgi:N-hydroxyarylamine O-acetyltransferase
MPRSFPGEYEAACHYHQKSPQSSFTRSPVISRATADGRVTLTNDKLTITRGGQRTERSVQEDEWPALLSDIFGVAL